METIGNKIANVFWEHRKPNVAFPISCDSERNSYIKQKYISKSFCIKGKPDPLALLQKHNFELKSEDLLKFYVTVQEQSSNSKSLEQRPKFQQ